MYWLLAPETRAAIAEHKPYFPITLDGPHLQWPFNQDQPVTGNGGGGGGEGEGESLHGGGRVSLVSRSLFYHEARAMDGCLERRYFPS